MKKDIHPQYRDVVFQDVAANFSFLTRSSIKAHDTVKWEDGKEYPLVRVDISSASHPFFTGKQKFVDTAGRVERFQRKFQGNYFGKAEAKKD
ncbi:MAG: type B 50S ribosomal protein L31 [Phycisphaeraceae bacterium]